MLNDRNKLEALEASTLAPVALRASLSRGRRHPESEHLYRTCFQRDRDRIIHCDAFRRLKYKTQVFINWAGDHFRTRMSHSIEVAQCARTIARALGLNEDVCEAVALSHDLGHTPFGHAGEMAMRECMKAHGGYEHNGQSLRIVDSLEHRYKGFDGLNLTHEVRQGLMKHETDYDKPLFSALDKRESASLEAQVVNFADEISYNAHDAEDGLYSGFLGLEEGSEAVLFEEAVRAARDSGIEAADRARTRYFIVGYLKNVQVSDLLNATVQRLSEQKITTLEQVLAHKGPKLVTFSPEMAEKVKRLKHMLYWKLYKHRRVLRAMEKATRFMTEMFDRYVSDPVLMPGGFHRRVENGDEVHRVVCDYISGMTDRYALEQYKKLFDPDVW